MKKEIADLWTEALDSGRFTQGRENLAFRDRRGGLTHCCLGVLCELAVEAGVEVKRVALPDQPVYFDGFVAYLPTSVREWADMHSNVGYYPGGNLAGLNDEGMLFPEIANVIRENVDSL